MSRLSRRLNLLAAGEIRKLAAALVERARKQVATSGHLKERPGFRLLTDAEAEAIVGADLWAKPGKFFTC